MRFRRFQTRSCARFSDFPSARNIQILSSAPTFNPAGRGKSARRTGQQHVPLPCRARIRHRWGKHALPCPQQAPAAAMDPVLERRRPLRLDGWSVRTLHVNRRDERGQNRTPAGQNLRTERSELSGNHTAPRFVEEMPAHPAFRDEFRADLCSLTETIQYLLRRQTHQHGTPPPQPSNRPGQAAVRRGITPPHIFAGRYSLHGHPDTDITSPIPSEYA